MSKKELGCEYCILDENKNPQFDKIQESNDEFMLMENQYEQRIEQRIEQLIEQLIKENQELKNLLYEGI